MVRLRASLATRAEAIEHAIDRLLAPVKGGEARLIDAMRYATLGGGKRLRGYLVAEVASMFGVDGAAAYRVAASVEMLHAYSLVHDDLPAMDDDDLRRGQPSTHRKFDEATAILAGDALQTMSFGILADPATHSDAGVRIELVTALAAASGAAGMVGGQMIDMEGEGRSLSLEEVARLHALKTGCLIRYSAEAGAILGQARADVRERIAAYGRDLGAAFQVADDVLDATASAEELGKTAGKDEAAGKSTYVALLGVEGAAREARRLAEQAKAHLDIFGSEADRLRDLVNYVVERRN
ncbi:polyprenyl synthetase family protein [Novacetimonas pomaceti]|uniref:Farnesyl-diphosphate synthase n=1 Tax=Novacetimonas pomaceti TaxID=2021998 RepID=A0A318QWB6_9PROT|nr:farnesyl diphosphate synthase [Novacetimonas pomaceti]MBV1833742.1 polyprenyl synthetase family protein [Novacetimonas pomaceti]PYD47904.1 farnesyl-diphosphate synthase [Novacetimonas pomaceti]PYD77173.1 farnesyl-diphosphate synthase [Novacetimonas pomaceti]